MGVTGSDLTAPISLRDFITRADEVANEHARQLGWIVQPPSPLFLTVARKPQVCLSRCAILQSP